MGGPFKIASTWLQEASHSKQGDRKSEQKIGVRGDLILGHEQNEFGIRTKDD